MKIKMEVNWHTGEIEFYEALPHHDSRLLRRRPDLSDHKISHAGVMTTGDGVIVEFEPDDAAI